jgi:integrase
MVATVAGGNNGCSRRSWKGIYFVMAGKLTARTVESRTKRKGRYSDGDGLFLRVLDPGKRVYWTYRFTLGGKERETSIGPYPELSLADARQKHAELRAKVLSKIDPLAGKRSAAVVTPTGDKPTFGAMADDYVATHEGSWRNMKHRWQWAQTLTHHCKPIWDTPVDEVATADILAVLKPIWAKTPETASRLRGRVESVIDAARALGHIAEDKANPARWKGHLDHLLPKRARLTRGHHKALAYGDIPPLVKRLRTVQAGNGAALALEFLILTATRTGETLGAQWDEIDFDNAVWTIPPSRMKTGEEFSVPLGDRALDILRTLEPKRGHNPHVFVGRPMRGLSNMALAMLLRRLEIDATVHGCRTSFRTWCSEVAHVEFELAELCLSHRIGNAVSRVYNRTTMIERRRPIMSAWADHVTSSNAGNVVALRRA